MTAPRPAASVGTRPPVPNRPLLRSLSPAQRRARNAASGRSATASRGSEADAIPEPETEAERAGT